MSLSHPTVGFSDATAYLAPSLPWLTSSVLAADSGVEHKFPLVSREVTLRNTSASDMKLGFTLGGVKGANYFAVGAGQTLTFPVRVTSVWLSSSAGGTYSLYAGLALIPAGAAPSLSGSLLGAV
jgi:hypothetical protein